MANNLAVVEAPDIFGGTGGWVLSITDQTGSGLTDSFAATGLGFMKLAVVEPKGESFAMTGAGYLALVETVDETYSSTATKTVSCTFAVSENVSEQVAFTLQTSRVPFVLALTEMLPETLAMSMLKGTGNALAVSESPGDEYESTATTISDSVLRHVRDSV